MKHASGGQKRPRRGQRPASCPVLLGRRPTGSRNPGPPGRQRDVGAFVELTRRFQQFAFGSALAMVGDFHRAEDVVQEAFVAAWSALPTLSEPKAFPSWLRTIVRHRALAAPLRRGHLDDPAPAGRRRAAERRGRRRRPARAARPGGPGADRRRPIAGRATRGRRALLPARLLAPGHSGVPRPLDDGRQQPPHAARSKLKERMLAMVSDTPSRQRPARRLRQPHRPPGREPRQRDRGAVRPTSLPDLDRACRQRRGEQARRCRSGRAASGRRAGTRRDAVARHRAAARCHGAERAAPQPPTHRPGGLRRPRDSPHLSARRRRGCSRPASRRSTCSCPLAAGGTVAIAGEQRAGTTVVMEEHGATPERRHRSRLAVRRGADLGRRARTRLLARRGAEAGRLQRRHQGRRADLLPARRATARGPRTAWRASRRPTR